LGGEDCAATSRKYDKYLEVIVQRYDIGVRLGYLLEDGNLIPDLGIIGSAVCARGDRPQVINLPCVLCPP
jgi:hypothetical protein